MATDKLHVNRYELTQGVEDHIIEFIKRHPRDYVYCGEVAVHVHNNLEWTQWALEELTYRGVLCKPSDQEKKQNDIDCRACVYSLPHTK